MTYVCVYGIINYALREVNIIEGEWLVLKRFNTGCYNGDSIMLSIIEGYAPMKKILKDFDVLEDTKKETNNYIEYELFRPYNAFIRIYKD